MRCLAPREWNLGHWKETGKPQNLENLGQLVFYHSLLASGCVSTSAMELGSFTRCPHTKLVA